MADFLHRAIEVTIVVTLRRRDAVFVDTLMGRRQRPEGGMILDSRIDDGIIPFAQPAVMMIGQLVGVEANPPQGHLRQVLLPDDVIGHGPMEGGIRDLTGAQGIEDRYRPGVRRTHGLRQGVHLFDIAGGQP